jgi:glutamate-ammonia-ligase adenylyltransferase
MSENVIDLLQTCSRFGRRLLAAQPHLADEIHLHLNTPFTRQAMVDFLGAAGSVDVGELHARLRRLRSRVWVRTTARDLTQLADLDEVMRTYSDLAEVCIVAALAFHHTALAARHGEPRNADGDPQHLVVVGMGKLGGRELNVSSDIDLVLLYPEEGTTDGRAALSNHEFFIRLGCALNAALSENTADGYVFRVDLRLRPWGESGPLAMSYAMFEDYLVAQGRPWERYAWIKARPLSGERHHELTAIVRPFVYRKYLDFGALAAIRDLHVQIRREVVRREFQNNVKLGPGGIREIEFTAQVFQLIRGGQKPALQQQATLAVLAELERTALIATDTRNKLAAAYVFLRELEHRLQYLDDAQTQVLPDDAESQAMLARAINQADYATLIDAYEQHRSVVTHHFEQIFATPQADTNRHPLTELCSGALDDDAAITLLHDAGYSDPPRVRNALGTLLHATAALPESSQTRLAVLLPSALDLIGGLRDPEASFERFATLLQTIARRATYLALLVEYPAALRQLARLLSASPWAAQMLNRQPQLLDELIDPRQLMQAPDWTALAVQLATELDAQSGDTEQLMDSMRRFKQVQTLRLLAQDVAGELTLERLSDHLASLADIVLSETLKRRWAGLKTRHREQPKFAVIGYGKLGGKELGYASDLDLVFLYDDSDEHAAEIYARLAQRINTWLGTATATGILFETDLRLRPDGASGLLVSSLAAFRDYQTQQAWTWEHQALTRARFICGDSMIGDAFETLRRDLLQSVRDAARLRGEVVAMREKMHAGHPNRSDLFDLKHDSGGIVDVEFCVQYLVLAHSHDYAELADNVGNIALLKRTAACGLLPDTIALPAADAYRELRRMQHQIKLTGAEHARVPASSTGTYPAAVRTLWQTVFPG